MPLATVLSLRLALDRMVRTGATASDIARHLGLSSSTVRGLMQRVRQAGPDRTPDALQPRYEACGPRPLEVATTPGGDPRAASSTSPLGWRPHPR